MRRRLAIAALAGLLLGFSYTHVLWLLTIFLLAVFIRQLHGVSCRQRLILSLTFFASYWLIVINWIYVLGPLPYLLLTVVCLLPYAIVAIPSKQYSITFATTIVIAEFIHSEFPWGGFPWGLMAYTQTHSSIAQMSRIGGQYLVTFIVVVLATYVARPFRFKSWIGIAFVAGVVGLLNLLLPSRIGNGTVQVAAIQGSVPRAGYDFETQRRAVLNNHLAATRDFMAKDASETQLIIWPENAVDNDPINTQFVFNKVTALSKELNTPLLVGGLVATGKGDSEYNAGILWSQGVPGQRYEKHQLVPFGEYIPTGKFLRSWIERQFPYVPRMIPGTSDGTFSLPNNIIFGDVICFEIANENFVRERVRGGAQFITVQTNNATYASTSQPAQQRNITQFRAIENQRNIIVAATTGYTVFIDTNGRVTHEVPVLSSGYIADKIALHSEQEFVHRWDSHWFVILCVILSLFGVSKTRLKPA